MKKEEKIELLSYLINGSAILGTVIAFLLLINYLQITRHDPLESEVMKTLIERLEADPQSEALKNEIRNLDLLARKAFFNNQWQINTGALLLLICTLVFGISLKIKQTLRFSIVLPRSGEINDLQMRTVAQQGLITGGLILVSLALGASYFTIDHLKSFKVEESNVTEETPVEQIEIVDIHDGSQGLASIDIKSTEDTVKTYVPTALESVDQAEESSAQVYPDLSMIRSHHGAFRGSPIASGVSPHKNIPVNWDPGNGSAILWKTALAKKGNNSPVVWGDRLFLTAADESGKVIFCYNRQTGSLLWQREIGKIPGSPVQSPKVTDDTGLAAPTLATDGLGVYAIFANGDIICLDMSGKEVWSRNLGMPDNHYGHSSSLISWRKKLLVQYDTNRGGKVMALDCFTGKTVWETSRNTKISWSSPILATVGDKYQLILSADPLVAGYDPDTGKELWSIACMMGEVGPSPAFGSGLVFAANEYAKLVAIRPGPASATVVWESDEYLPEVASPVVSGGLVFIATSYGVLAGFDAMTGEKYWEHECTSGFYASPVVADGKLYALDMEGVMHIFEVNKEKKLIGEPSLEEKTVATPAFAPGRIYIRGIKNLYCIGS